MTTRLVWDPLRKKNVALTPEERVRQWFISLLQVKAHVPPYMMMSEVSIKMGKKTYRADILVYGKDLKPLLAVECKRDSLELSQKVIDQVIKYNMVLGVNYIAITNGKQTFFYSRKEDGFVAENDILDYTEMV